MAPREAGVCHKYAMFGGTFDPVHSGHMHVIEQVRARTDYNHIVCVPTSQNPFKNRPLASSFDRLQMLSLVTKHLDFVTVSDFEIFTKGKTYTIDTITHIREVYNISSKIGLVIGSDVLLNLLAWKDIKAFSSLVELIIVPRPHHEVAPQVIATLQDMSIAYIFLSDMPALEVDARYIRDALLQGKEESLEISKELSKEVRNYIFSHNMYRMKEENLSSFKEKHAPIIQMVMHTISHDRFTHSVRVSEIAYALAHRFDVSCEDAWLAGIVHDIARELSVEKMYEYAEQVKKSRIMEKYADIYFERVDIVSNKKKWVLYHGLAAVFLLEKKYPLHKKIYQAIVSHTLGAPLAEQLEKILFVADALDPHRNIWDEEKRKGIVSTYSLDQMVGVVIEELIARYGAIDMITSEMLSDIQKGAKDDT